MTGVAGTAPTFELTAARKHARCGLIASRRERIRDAMRPRIVALHCHALRAPALNGKQQTVVIRGAVVAQLRHVREILSFGGVCQIQDTPSVEVPRRRRAGNVDRRIRFSRALAVNRRVGATRLGPVAAFTR